MGVKPDRSKNNEQDLLNSGFPNISKGQPPHPLPHPPGAPREEPAATAPAAARHVTHRQTPVLKCDNNRST